ncbi:MAG TPA: hypothetical protein PKJ19_11190 [Flavobacteriales bacterium]|nr:hypothetical protein [Flavobacteriales bacterium]
MNRARMRVDSGSVRSNLIPGVLVLSVLVLTTLLYLPTLSFPFVDWDDPGYISENEGTGPLSLAQVVRESTRYVMGNWHPVTMLSYSVDLSLFGPEPGAMHAVNLLLHLLNALLVVVLVRRLTDDPLLAALAMAIWVVHPLRVESVAWLSARKDLLMTLFALLALLAWVQWRRTQRVPWYLAGLVAFVLSCLSKGMAVALVPCLWLVDAYLGYSWRSVRSVAEKLPFVALALAVGLVTLDAQTGVMRVFVQDIRPLDRFQLGPANLLTYAVMQVLPIDLNARYGYPLLHGHLPAWYAPACYTTLILLGLLAWRGSLRSIPVFAGWFFVAHTLLVLQWIPVGDAIRADRYTYLAGIGAALVIAHGLVWAGRWLSTRHARIITLSLAVVFLGWLATRTHARIPIWSFPVALWSDMIKGRPMDPIHYVDRAISHRRLGNDAAAMADFDRAVARAGKEYRPYYERGMHHLYMERYEEAMQDLLRVYQAEPGRPGLLANMLFAEYALGLCTDLERNATLALAKDSLSPDLWNLRAACRIEQGATGAAMSDLLRSLRSQRDGPETWLLLARALRKHGDHEQACGILLSGLAGARSAHPLMERLREEEMQACAGEDQAVTVCYSFTKVAWPRCSPEAVPTSTV